MMETIHDNVLTMTASPSSCRAGVLSLPKGLLGFERHTAFHVVGRADEAPFCWLQAADDPMVSFLVVSPFEVAPDYQPALSAEDTSYLRLTGDADPLYLNIVTLKPGGQATINLKGPIVVNPETRVGKQVVLANAAHYSVQHPLPVVT
jgi:flagellar assembly factor FliW